MTQDSASAVCAATDPLFTRRQAAVYLNTTSSTLARMAFEKRGPVHIKISSRCTKYRRSDLDAWLASKTVRPLADAAA